MSAMTTKERLKTLDKFARNFDLALGAKTRAMQYPAFTTGEKARDRLDFYVRESAALYLKLRADLEQLSNQDRSRA